MLPKEVWGSFFQFQVNRENTILSRLDDGVASVANRPLAMSHTAANPVSKSERFTLLVRAMCCQICVKFVLTTSVWHGSNDSKITQAVGSPFHVQ